MNEIQKHDANLKKFHAWINAYMRCQVCGKHLEFYNCELAHRIPKHKKYLKKYGPEIIHHPLNMRITCSKCNSRVLIDPATNPIEAEHLIKKIKADLEAN